MAVLQHQEAIERSRLIDSVVMLVAVDLTDETSFRSSVGIEFNCSTGGAQTFVDVACSSLVEATCNGERLDPATLADGRLPVPGLVEGRNVINVDALFDYSHDGEGLHAHVDPADERRYVYAMSFLNAAPRWFACFDQPDLKARLHFLVTAPESWRILGNAPARVVEELDGARVWEIKLEHPISTYLATLAGGEWASVETQHDGIALGVHARASLLAPLEQQADDILGVTARTLDDYHRLFDVRYPFGEYHQVFVPDFNAGAMENPGCVLLRDSMIFRGQASEQERASRAGTIAHELAHQWFGDLVTMRWWDDLWLNESFAEYMAHRVLSERGEYELWTDFGMSRKFWGGMADRSPSTHPVAASGARDTDEALMNFDGISYAKGAALLKQVVKQMGDEKFLAGLRQYFADFAFGNATLADLLSRWEAAGATGLDAWRNDWLTTTGMDTLTLDGDDVVVAGPEGGGTPRTHVVDVTRWGADGLAGRQPLALREGRTRLPDGEGRALLDVGDDAWAVVRALSPEDLGGGPSRLGKVEEASARVAHWSSLRWGVRDALLDPQAAMATVIRELPAERDPAILTPLLAWAAGQLLDVWLPAATRSTWAGRLAEAAAAAMEGEMPGSDRHLTLLRTRLNTSRDPEWLRDWLDGQADGSSNDPSLRWLAITRLAALTADTDAITAELGRDRSTQAAISAARARAMVPTTDAKEYALSAVLHDSAMAPHELYAIGEGLFDGEHAAITEPYALRFFDGLADVAHVRKGWVLGRSIQSAFPDSVATGAVLTAAERALERDLAPAVRRVVVDGAERLRLVLASHRAFPAPSIPGCEG